MMSVDFFLIILILLSSFSIRLGYWYFPIGNLTWLIFCAPFLAIPIFYLFGLYRTVIRYVGFRALWGIVKAVTLYGIIWGLVSFMVVVDGIPRSVILINWVLTLLALGSLRVGARWFFSVDLSFNDNAITNVKYKNALIYGAGDAGIQLMEALKHSSEYKPFGFIDDLKELQGQYIGGVRVYSPEDISAIVQKFKIEDILIALPSTSRSKRLNIVDMLQPYPVTVRMLPSVSALAGGKVSIDDLHKVSIKDLLGRDVVPANLKLLSKNITSKIVLVTGAGGSIGSELCRQIISLKPKKLIMFEMSEIALYNIENKLLHLGFTQESLYPVLGNILNKSRFSKVLSHFNVETIYHSAAYKHVPIVEFNNTEGVNNNIFGTLNCAQAAINNNVKTFVLISTDKAVRPTNTMGATKRSAELILQAMAAKQSTTKFTMVRFGNVLDSSGSVIPLFKKQIKDGGPITVTDKDIIRYFMMIPEAVELVIQAGAMGTGGDVFVLDMGNPVRIDDLAKKMIRLSGLNVKDEDHPDGDIEIKYVGLRPGEKLYEELLAGDNVSITNNPLIMRAEEKMILWAELKPMLDSLKKETEHCNQEKIRKLLTQLVPDFEPNTEIKDILYK